MASKLNKARAREYQARCQRNQTEERYQIQKAKLEAQERTIKALREQNAQLKVALIRWRQRQWPDTDQTAVIERDFPQI